MIAIKELSKSYQTADGQVDALKQINLTIQDGEIYGIIGMSGAGKSTLVRCINMLERPSEGEVWIDGVEIGGLSEKERRNIRRSMTMIFQGINLLMQRTCLKNICFPLELAGVKRHAAEKRAKELLELVGLSDKANAYPAQLSGGQQQRIAIARALATDPKVLLCDEATSALDPKTTHSILSLIREINQKMGITVIIITHQMRVVEEICSQVAILDNGTVAEQGAVTEVFSHPKSDAAKRLVFPERLNEDAQEVQFTGSRIRVVFHGASAVSEPLIATLAVEKQIYASILSASTRSVGGLVYGDMLLGVAPQQAAQAIEYLRQYPEITAQEV